MGPFILYLWIWFSNNCIHNAFLAIVGDGYALQSKETQFSWLTDDLKDPDVNRIIGEDSDEEIEFTCDQFIKSLKKTEHIYLDFDSSKNQMNILDILEVENQKK